MYQLGDAAKTAVERAERALKLARRAERRTAQLLRKAERNDGLSVEDNFELAKLESFASDLAAALRNWKE